MSLQPFPDEELTETAVKALEEMLLDGVVKESAVAVPFFSHDRLTRSKLFIAILSRHLLNMSR